MYGDAIGEYTKAIEKLSAGNYDVTMNKCEAALHSNRALCYLKVLKITLVITVIKFIIYNKNSLCYLKVSLIFFLN